MKKIICLMGFTILIFSCTNLEEDLNDTVTTEVASATADPQSLLESAYQAVRPFNTQDNIYAAQEHTTDEMAGPTRGADWDDAGIWRTLHTHQWTNSHSFIASGYTSLLSGIFRSTQVLEFDPNSQQIAEAKFLRAFFAFHAVDNFGLVLGREPGEDLTNPPSITLKRAEGIDFVISELESIINDLPTNSSAGLASQNAAHALLSKAYLNRAVYKATDPTTNAASAGPFSFDADDMNKVIESCDEIIASNQYSLATDYFDNFSPTNTDDSTENIFVGLNDRGNNDSNTRSRWHMTLHYNQEPSGWNGFVTLSDLYNSFETSDTRKYSKPDYFSGNTGLNAGFLVGQQYDKDGGEIQERNDIGPLSFTEDFSLTSSNDANGIRVIKYTPDYVDNDFPGNDYVFFRYADILMMKAEAILRGGTPTEGDTSLSLVNEIRDIRGASLLVGLDLIELLAERRRELYWEGWRRNDQIRFGTFLDAYHEKPASTETYLLFPIPPSALSSNPNLTQNPGY